MSPLGLGNLFVCSFICLFENKHRPVDFYLFNVFNEL